jgi:hypothetical protein
MGRKKKQITASSDWSAIEYFLKKLKLTENSFLKDSEQSFEAKSKLEKIIGLGNTKYGKFRPGQVQAWCNHYVNPAAIKKFWSNLRQKKHFEKSESRQIRITAENLILLDEYIKKHENCENINDALGDLLRGVEEWEL